MPACNQELAATAVVIARHPEFGTWSPSLLARGLHGADFRRADRRSGSCGCKLELTTECVDLLLHARRWHPRSSDRDRPSLPGERNGISMPLDSGLTAHSLRRISLDCAISGAGSSHICRAASISTMLLPMICPKGARFLWRQLSAP